MSGWLTALCVGALLCFPEGCMRAASEAAALFAASVLPALFPMSVLAALPRAKRSENARSERFDPLWTALFGWAAGSPAGARRVAEDARAGRVTGGVVEPLLVTVGVMSPMFFIGTLAQWLGNPRAGLRLWAVHLLTSALTGALRAALPRGKPAPDIVADMPPRAIASEAALPEAILSAARGMLAVCGAMMLFSILGAVLREALTRLAPAWVAENAPALAVAQALLEIGGGAHEVVRAFDAPLAPLSALCAFGGLSLWAQTLAFAGACARPARLLGWRAVHGALAYAVCALWEALSPLPPTSAAAFASAPIRPFLPSLAPLLLLAFLPASWRKSRTCSPHS